MVRVGSVDAGSEKSGIEWYVTVPEGRAARSFSAMSPIRALTWLDGQEYDPTHPQHKSIARPSSVESSPTLLPVAPPPPQASPHNPARRPDYVQIHILQVTLTSYSPHISLQFQTWNYVRTDSGRRDRNEPWRPRRHAGPRPRPHNSCTTARQSVIQVVTNAAACLP